jgi:hypothetical protein
MTSMFDTALTDLGWLTFVQEKHELRPVTLQSGTPEGDGAYATMTVFVNHRNRIRSVKLMPYMPVTVRYSASTAPAKLQRQWLDLGDGLTASLGEYGIDGVINLSPNVLDVRPMQWGGYAASVRYTYAISLPDDASTRAAAVRKNINKAVRLGYTTVASTDYEAVVRCLESTEQRQGFSYGITAEDLARLEHTMAPGTLKTYLTRDGEGNLASSRVVLAKPGGTALDLLAGTYEEHLRHGATQITIGHALSDLSASGSLRFDYGGANIRNVAAAKMDWGCDLVPFYSISQPGLKSIAREGMSFVRRIRTGRS